MAKPIISNRQGNVGVLQWQALNFQPALEPASPAATSWAATGLPPGVTINTSTGLCSGTVSAPGVYHPALVASNGDGASDPVVFYFAVEATLPTAGGDIDCTIDWLTREVRLTIPPPLAGAPGEATATTMKPTPPGSAAYEALKATALLTAKGDDDLIFRVHFQKGAVVVDPSITSLQLTAKEFDGDDVLVTSSGFVRDGTGGSATFRVHIKFDGDPLTGELSNYQRQTGTQFLLRMEFEWVADRPDGDTLGPTTRAGSSETFYLVISRPQQAM